MKKVRTKSYCDVCESSFGSCSCCTRYIDMYEYSQGDIFQSGAEALVNPCNTVGAMGAGLALAFKRKFPAMNKDYVKFCNEGKLRPGVMHVWEGDNPKFIINFPTKEHYVQDSKLEYITKGLEALKQVVEEKEIKSIAVPAIGTGLGNLSWDIVKPLLEEFADSLPEYCKVIIYEPH